jgi:CRISPR-associated protein (Cas_csx3)
MRLRAHKSDVRVVLSMSAEEGRSIEGNDWSRSLRGSTKIGDWSALVPGMPSVTQVLRPAAGPPKYSVAMPVEREVVIDLRGFYGETAKLADSSGYVEKAQALAGDGKIVILTGQAPVWLYLQIAHGLHGKARKLFYRTPAIESDVLIFNHDPY